MNLLRLLGRLGPAPLRRLVLYALGSALFSTLVLALVNRGAEEIAAEKADFVNVPLAAAFVVSVLLYMLVEGRMVAHLSADAEEVVDTLRMRLLDQIRRADLWKLERFGQTPLFESVTQSSQLISQNSQFLALTVRSVLLTGTILLYIATISPVAFLLIGGLLGAGTWFYIRLGRALEERQRAMMAEEAALFEGVSDLFDGFKEQRLNSARSHDLNAAFGAVSGRTTTARGEVHLHTWQQFVFGECAFNLMLGVVVFVVPTYSSAISAELVKITSPRRMVRSKGPTAKGGSPGGAGKANSTPSSLTSAKLIGTGRAGPSLPASASSASRPSRAIMRPAAASAALITASDCISPKTGADMKKMAAVIFTSSAEMALE